MKLIYIYNGYKQCAHTKNKALGDAGAWKQFFSKIKLLQLNCNASLHKCWFLYLNGCKFLYGQVHWLRRALLWNTKQSVQSQIWHDAKCSSIVNFPNTQFHCLALWINTLRKPYWIFTESFLCLSL